jgi:hypothetical protein
MNEKLQTVSYVEYLDRKVLMDYVSDDSQEKSQVWNISYCHVYAATIDGVWTGDWTYCTLNTTRYYTSQISVGHTRSSKSVVVFYCHCLVVASNGRCSPSSGFQNHTQFQLPASNSNISQ